MSEWKLLECGQRPIEAAEEGVERTVRRLAKLVSVERMAPTGGIAHEAGTPAERAEALAESLSAGQVPLLACGPSGVGLTVGDPLLAQILPHLDRGLRGTIVGSFGHAHALSVLATVNPDLDVLLGPPAAEVLGHPTKGSLAEAAAAELVVDWQSGEPSLALAPHQAHVGACYWGAGPEEDPLGALQEVRPHVLRHGRGVGRVVACSAGAALLDPKGMLEAPGGTILFLEAAHMRLIEVDHVLQFLRVRGVFERLTGLVLGVPVQLVPSRMALSYEAIVERAIDGTDFPVVADAFCGSGYPAPLLRLGREAALATSSHEAELVWH